MLKRFRTNKAVDNPSYTQNKEKEKAHLYCVFNGLKKKKRNVSRVLKTWSKLFFLN